MEMNHSCHRAIQECLEQKYFALAHLYNEESTMDMHIHDCYEIYYSISGGKQILIDNKMYDMAPGDLFAINQFESHYVCQVDKMVHERIVISIHPDFLKSLSSKETRLDACFLEREDKCSHKISLNKEQQNRFRYYVNKIVSARGFGSDLLERAVFTELMILINGIYQEHRREDDSRASHQYSDQVEQILQYLNKHINEDITIERLANHFFLSDSYICRIFKASTGTTINKYITARRISIAKSLLAAGYNVNTVCEQCGYNDYSNFLKAFTKAVGISPKKYSQNSQY